MKPNPSRFFIPAVLLLCVLSSAPLRAQSPPAAYDLRAVVSGLNTEAWVPAVQDQGSAEDCWTFAAATAMNSNLLLTGTLPSVSTPPPIQISSWHLSTTNGSPDQLLATEAFSNNNSNWGGFEYQTLGYVTRGSGSWQIPNVPAVNSGNYVQTMGGGPVLESSNPLNPFPQTISQMSGYPANLSSLIPPASQPAAYQVTSMVFYDQGYSSNVALPTATGTVTISGTTYDTYSYTQGAADPQVAAVKSGIAQFGAVTTSMNADFNDFHFVAGSGPAPYTVEYFNNQTATGYSDHEVTIIGWDDNYSMTDPGTNITYTGAWLVQNSWGTNYWTGTDRQNDGTFWAPYNDAVIGRSGISSYQLRSNAGFSQTVIQNELGPMDYAGNFSAIGGTSPAWIGSPTGMASRQDNVVASILTPQSDGMLTALGVATQASNVSLQLQIFSDWNNGPSNLLSTQTFLLDGIGYHVLDLASAISLTALDSFVVELTYLDATTLQALQDAVPIVIGDGGLGGDYLHVPHNLSFYYSGSAWHDLADEIFSAYSGSPDSHGGVLFLKGITAVPEPSTIACVLMGGILLAVWRRSSKAG